MSNRQERRRRARERGEHPRDAKSPQPRVVLVGDNMVAASLGQQYAARQGAKLPPKIIGVHRWVAAASWVLNQDMARSSFDASDMRLLDAENMMYLAIGCWDCEKVLGQEVDVDSPCPAHDVAE